MNSAGAEVAVAAVVLFTVGLVTLGAFGQLYRWMWALALCDLGAIVAFAGFSASGGGAFPQYGDAVAIVITLVAALQLMLLFSVGSVIWRRYQTSDVDDLDGVEV